MKTLEKQVEAISRLLHYTTEPFDYWNWTGTSLEVYLNEKRIERYSYKDLKELIFDL